MNARDRQGAGRHAGAGCAYVLGVAVAPAAARRDDVRLEELVYRTARAALDDAGVSRWELDNVTLGASDELDGRPISSMLLAAPAGAYLTDEIRVTDSGATALCLATARHASGMSGLGLVASWCKSSKADIPGVMNGRSEPFFIRDLGFDDVVADALLAQAISTGFGVDEPELIDRVIDGHRRAALNPRAIGYPVPSREDVVGSGFTATPLRSSHRASATDGAACLVVASGDWLDAHPGHRPLARIAGVGWSSDAYRLDRERLTAFDSARAAWRAAMRMAGEGAPDVVELECPTVFHEAAYTRVLQIADAAVSPSGGVYAQNPLVATGLVNAAEAILQVSDRAGAVQVDGARRAVAHSCHGFAQQSNVVMVLDRVDEVQDV